MTTILEPPRAPERTRLAVRETLSQEVAHVRRTQRRRWALVSPGMLAAGVALAVFFAVPHTRVPDLVNVAMAEHRLYLKDPRRLQFHASDRRVAGHWLGQRVPFPLRIPNIYAADVRLVGAAVKTGPNTSVILTYEWGGMPVSLLIAPTRTIPFDDAEALTFRNALFHTARLEGRHVLQWSDDRYTYVLVACREIPIASLPFAEHEPEEPPG
jgi:anti-sigma factor RsiW